MTPHDAMQRIDSLLTHVWMVRAFLKHSDEAETSDEVCEIHRALYDFMLALGGAWQAQDAATYLKLARKKIGKLRAARDDFARLQPEISTHTNFQMAVRSLGAAVTEIDQVLGQAHEA